MQEYVVGFMFNELAREFFVHNEGTVALVQKNRPPNQAGKYNGIGGHVEESDENLWMAMRREFFEETGVDHNDWVYKAEYLGEGYKLHIFFKTHFK